MYIYICTYIHINFVSLDPPHPVVWCLCIYIYIHWVLLFVAFVVMCIYIYIHIRVGEGPKPAQQRVSLQSFCIPECTMVNVLCCVCFYPFENGLDLHPVQMNCESMNCELYIYI